MQLLYLWVEEYKNIHKQGFNFSSRYIFDYNSDEQELTRKDNPYFIEGLFPEGIQNVTAIVGSNGSGKSTVLEILATAYSSYVFFVIQTNNNLLTIYCCDKLNITSNFEHELEDFNIDTYKEQPSTSEQKYSTAQSVNNSHVLYNQGPCIFYSPIFTGDYTRLPTDLTFYLPDENLRPFSQVFDYRTPKLVDEGNYALRTTERQINFLADQRNQHVLPFSNYPRELEIFAIPIDRQSQWYNDEYPAIAAIKTAVEVDLKQLNEDISNSNYKAIFIRTLYWNIFINLLADFERKNISYEFNHNTNKNPGDYAIEAIQKLITHDKSKQDIYEEYQQKIETFINHLNSPAIEYEYFRRGEPLFPIKELGFSFTVGIRINLQNENGTFQSNKLEKFLEDFFNAYKDIAVQATMAVDNPVYLAFEWKGFSSGELSMLNLYSIFHSLKKRNLEHDFLLILIDEGETYFHPQWQKQYIKSLVDFLPKIYPDKKIQIILTSNSPFVASDLPDTNIIFLEKDPQTGNALVRSGLQNMKQTFGANIHTLLTDSFFMKDGLMGTFAQNKIKKVISYLNGETNDMTDDEAQKYIRIIGEPILRKQLQKMLDSKKLSTVDKIKQEIEKLTKRLDKLEGK